MVLNFILTWFGLYWLVITAMFIDNLCWISSSPEFSKVKNYSLKDYLKYCFKDRIWAVIKDYRDILPTNTSITVDVSDDGGSTFALTGKSLNTAIDTSTFTTGDLALKFNLATTDTSVTPKLYGYGVAITN